MTSTIVNKIPGWVTVGLGLAGGAAFQVLETNTNLLTDLRHLSTAWPDVRSALLVGGAVLWGYLKTDPWTQSAINKIARSEAPTK
jgi:hypothetical protein